MWLRTTCNLTFRPVFPTPFIFMLRPRSRAQQWVARDVYTLRPSVAVAEYTDHYGNLCQRVVAPPGEFSIWTSADVMVPDCADVAPEAPFVLVQNLPDTVLEFLLPSRYCESDRLRPLAQQVIGNARPGYQQVACIVDWIHRSVRYVPGSSNVPISAMEVRSRGEGVCRDLAHLGVALCRSLAIPARMVAGYLHELEPMDLHAWFEAYVGGRWYTFDPARGNPDGGRVVIAYGRDAADIAVFNQFGPALFPSSMEVAVERLHSPST